MLWDIECTLGFKILFHRISDSKSRVLLTSFLEPNSVDFQLPLLYLTHLLNYALELIKTILSYYSTVIILLSTGYEPGFVLAPYLLSFCSSLSTAFPLLSLCLSVHSHALWLTDLCQSDPMLEDFSRSLMILCPHILVRSLDFNMNNEWNGRTELKMLLLFLLPPSCWESTETSYQKWGQACNA